MPGNATWTQSADSHLERLEQAAAGSPVHVDERAGPEGRWDDLMRAVHRRPQVLQGADARTRRRRRGHLRPWRGRLLQRRRGGRGRRGPDGLHRLGCQQRLRRHHRGRRPDGLRGEEGLGREHRGRGPQGPAAARDAARVGEVGVLLAGCERHEVQAGDGAVLHVLHACAVHAAVAGDSGHNGRRHGGRVELGIGGGRPSQPAQRGELS